MSDPGSTDVSRTELLERAATAYVALSALGQTIDDEWQYVADLVEAYLPAIQALGRGEQTMAQNAAVAVDEAIAEIESIDDPHRAIDWLSTFPHVVALALGGDVDAGEPAPSGGEPGDETGRGPGEGSEPDEDSPFRILGRGGR